MNVKRTYDVFDGLDMPPDPAPPREWRLLRLGGNPLVKEGRELALELTPERLASAARVQEARGEKIPLDSRHALFLAAAQAGLEESEYLRQVPQGVAALGFGELEARDDGLWLVDAEWTPLAARLWENGSLRFFSPVVRGLGGGSPFRITSVALDNVPALSNLETIAAGGEDAPATNTTTAYNTKEASMDKLKKALSALLGDTALALGAEAEIDNAAERVQALADELPGLREKALRADALGAEVEALKTAAETARRKALVDSAMARGGVCEAQRAALMGMESSALEGFLKAFPDNAAVPMGADGADPAARPADDESLSDEERELIDIMGIDAEAYIAARRMARERQAKEAQTNE